MLARLIFAACTLLFATAPVWAQDASPVVHKGKLGLGLDGIAGSPDFLLKYFVTDAVAVQVIAGYNADWPGGDAPTGTEKVNGSDLRVGVGALYHMTFDRLSPYFGARVLYRSQRNAGFAASEPDLKNHLVVGAVLGGECFLHDRFSLGVQHAVDLSIAMKRDKPAEASSTSLGTSTLVTGRFYFN